MRNAQIADPIAVAVDDSGIIYAASSLGTICKIAPGGLVSPVAGYAGGGGARGGKGVGAPLAPIRGLAVDAGGNLYVAAGLRGNNTIRRITPGGEASTLAGGAVNRGSAGGPAAIPPFSQVAGVAVGPAGEVYAADFGHHTIRKISAGGLPATLAGQPDRPGNADGTASDALFEDPQGIRLDRDGSLLVLESAAGTIRRITPDGAVSTVAHFEENVRDASGASAAGTFRNCRDFALDKEGNLYIADAGDHIILKGVRRSGQPAAYAESKRRPAQVPAPAAPAIAWKAPPAGPPPEAAGMAFIPEGPFLMGDSLDGERDAIPAIPVYVSAFYMDRNLVSYSLWQSVAKWAISHGYQRLRAFPGQEASHPVVGLDWNECVTWCNVRSQQEGLTPVYYADEGWTQVYMDPTPRSRVATPCVNWMADGYRLPTEAEWEKAARGGLDGQRFPWGDTISESQANYRGDTSYLYDSGPNGYSAAFANGGIGDTSPAGSFASNGFGLFDMAGNVMQWCWDWYGVPYAGGGDPRGPASGSEHVQRGGSWNSTAYCSRCAYRFQAVTNSGSGWNGGFRCVREFEGVPPQGAPVPGPLSQAPSLPRPAAYPAVPTQNNATASPSPRQSQPAQQRRASPLPPR